MLVKLGSSICHLDMKSITGFSVRIETLFIRTNYKNVGQSFWTVKFNVHSKCWVTLSSPVRINLHSSSVTSPTLWMAFT